MRPFKNIMETIEHVKINDNYDLQFKDMMELINAYKEKPYDLLSAGFRIGYLQGSKAERAERRRRHG